MPLIQAARYKLVAEAPPGGVRVDGAARHPQIQHSCLTALRRSFTIAGVLQGDEGRKARKTKKNEGDGKEPLSTDSPL